MPRPKHPPLHPLSYFTVAVCGRIWKDTAVEAIRVAVFWYMLSLAFSLILAPVRCRRAKWAMFSFRKGRQREQKSV